MGQLQRMMGDEEGLFLLTPEKTSSFNQHIAYWVHPWASGSLSENTQQLSTEAAILS